MRVVVAMSGGVDSSVAAALLCRQGHDVVGITIKTYRYEDVGGNEGNESSCCSLDGINDARAVAAQWGFPHFVLDFSERFDRDVISPFVSEYLAGRTPNPCVLCNRSIKWEELLRKADALGAEYIATGHYARMTRDDRTGRSWISVGNDKDKDQSYALWTLSQDLLGRTLFPLGSMTKTEVRALADELGLACARKAESFEICFIPDNRYDRFLSERTPGLRESVNAGEIVMDGKVLGHHQGYPFYTVGQRKGLGIATGEPLYVTAIDPQKNTVHVGREESLLHNALIARDVQCMKYAKLPDGISVLGRIRYKDAGDTAKAWIDPDGTLRVIFDAPRRAITPGQSVVLYEGGDLVAGGIIERAFDAERNVSP